MIFKAKVFLLGTLPLLTCSTILMSHLEQNGVVVVPYQLSIAVDREKVRKHDAA